MRFREVRSAIIKALEEGSVQHEARKSIDTKNYLLTGELSSTDLISLLKHARGNEHREDRHHSDASISVHIVVTRGWYIKFYFLDPDAWFISAHPSDTQ